MAPRTWHGEEHQAFFLEYIPKFNQRQAQQKLYKFWGPMFEAWFHLFPEEKFLDWPVAGPGETAIPLSNEQIEILGKAISKRKQMLENYFRNNRAKLEPGAAKKHKSLFALAKSLFKAKPQRKRAHKAIEIFQLRNNRLIREECTREGHDSINEESMAAAVVDWVNESDADQLARIKAAQAARLRLRNRVVRALFAEASEEELQAIAEAMEGEKAGEFVSGDEDDAGLPARTPAEFQASIDESWEVMKKVHTAIERMTGWYGFSIWGGPNPRIGGELSMKSVSFGLGPTGLDFEATHADFEKAVEIPFQLFLRRCFPPELRAARSLDAVISDTPSADDETTLDPAFRLPNDEDVPAKTRPKRMRKPKTTVAPPAKTTKTTTASIPTTTQTPMPTDPPLLSRIPLASAVATTVQALEPSMSTVDTTSIRNGDVSPYPVTNPASPTENTQPSSLDSAGSTMYDQEIFSGLDSFLEGDGFELDGGEGMDERDGYGMPPLPSASTWERAPIEGYTSPQAPSNPIPASTNFGGFNLPATSSHPDSRITSLFADYRRITQDSPTRSLSFLNSFNPATSHPFSAPHGTVPRDADADEGSSPVPARFRRSFDSSPIAPAPQWGVPSTSSQRLPALSTCWPISSVATAGSASLTSSTTLFAPITAQPPSTLAIPSALTLPPAPRQPVLPQSRPAANIPKPAVAKLAVKPAVAKATAKKSRAKQVPKKAKGKAGATAEARDAAKVAEKKKAGGRRGKAAAAAANSDDGGDDVMDQDVGVLADTSNTLIYTSTNNTIKFDREVKARQAAAAAAKAPIIPNLLHNPDGPSDLVILPPPPGRPRRTRQAPTHPDNTTVALPVKLTLAERREMSNAKMENALLKRSGRIREASSSVKGRDGGRGNK
ncbi:hypothetical protein C8R43DRAFT_1124685 [Mycena crocata]|nr:hypothetical protein C8R43DRAFT_1124685 [Mycena crocata]